jgi:hypothetical protein
MVSRVLEAYEIVHEVLKDFAASDIPHLESPSWTKLLSKDVDVLKFKTR